MNILLTSAGRRTYMVDYFKEALDGEGLLFGANSQMSPALEKSDGYFISPIIYSEEYIPFLLRICRENSISLIVSLFDIDVPVLDAHRAEFEAIGVRVAVSGKELLDNCSDKLKMTKTLMEIGLEQPKTYTSVSAALDAISEGAISWPLLIKPRFGMGSIGVLKAADEIELAGAFSMCRRAVENSYLRYESAAAPEESVLIQELKSGDEYGLDIISDLDGAYVNTIIRKKYAMRSGETDEAVIIGQDDECYDALMKVGKTLAETFHPVGLIDVDVMMEPVRGGIPYVIDINARFGGGYPFSHVAGANVPKAYVLWQKAEQDAANAEAFRKEAAAFCTAEPGVHGYKDILPTAY